MTTIRLRVVGIFYDQAITVGSADPTVRDILQQAIIDSAGRFSYVAESRLSSPSTQPASPVRVIESLVSFTHILQDDLSPSLGNKTRETGRYTLSESTVKVDGSEIVNAWQYYVVRNGMPISNAYTGNGPFDVSPAKPVLPAKSGFTPYNEFVLANGDELIWRNVSIVRNPATS